MHKVLANKLQSGNPITPNSPESFHNRSKVDGVRNMQESNFSLSGAQFDDDKPRQGHTRVANPPGGRSTGL
ncbi:hypothetical protein SNE40_003855 [Patella caerulea]|uniref:Uncharacterized protein n=1 Tax=Patella caerulea TaxID=87958 RepID=A0AAN8Q1A4_PATCE